MPLVDIIGIKPAHGDHKSNLKKVSAIPSEPERLYNTSTELEKDEEELTFLTRTKVVQGHTESLIRRYGVKIDFV